MAHCYFLNIFIKMGNLCAQQEPVCIPQHETDPLYRANKLQEAAQKYQLEQKNFELPEMRQRMVNMFMLPPMLKKLPDDEKISLRSKLHLAVYFVFFTFYGWIHSCIGGGRQMTIAQMIQHFKFPCLIKEPKGCEVWKEERVNTPDQNGDHRMQADYWFVWQRLNGVTRNLIKRAQGLPQQFVPFTAIIENNHPYLAGNTLEIHAEQNELYIVDLAEVALGEPNLLAPKALFVKFNGKLMPVAIWMNIIDPGQENQEGQVYIPKTVLNENDEGEANMLLEWVKMKMTFNMLEAQYHESITHLGFTHLLMDGVSVCMHATLSYRHPIYKLLRPHFQYMHAINEKAREELLQPGGYVEKDMYIGRLAMLNLIMEHNNNWIYTPIQDDFQNREVAELPNYHFREDALKLEGAIRNFVEEYVCHYYDNNNTNLQEDVEIQNWHQNLTAQRGQQGGCGMRGIPAFNNLDNLIDVLTYFIYTCSVEHSATNFPQYEQYAFPPNFAAVLHGQPEQGMDGLNSAMPTRKEMFSTIKIMQVLTRKLTNSLGNYAACYLNAMDDAGRGFVVQFQDNLNDIQDEIFERNAKIVANQNPIHDYPYEWLLPKNVLNSISI